MEEGEGLWKRVYCKSYDGETRVGGGPAAGARSDGKLREDTVSVFHFSYMQVRFFAYSSTETYYVHQTKARPSSSLKPC